MSALGRGVVLRQIDRLFGEGTLAGLGDGPLLERYLSRGDEDAFEALVDRHGPMVLGLCRRMLRDPRDVEDAFQATFLVLARKASTIRDRGLLANWLYGVAHRVARRARARTLRRRDRESAVGDLEIAAEAEPERSDVGPVLDQELGRLPEKYRAPLVLCYLRGQTHDQAAAELRCPVGTVRSRMARGRDLLRRRLERRGLAPSSLAAVLGGDSTFPARLLVASVPPPLAAATVRAAVGFGASPVLKAGAAAATSAALARGVIATMKFAQMQWIGLVVVASGLSAGGVVAAGYAGMQDRGRPAPGSPAAEVAQGEDRGARPQATEERLRALEGKIDQLMNRLPGPDRVGPRRRDVTFMDIQTSVDESPRDPFRESPRATQPIGELETQLRLAFDEFRRVDALRRENTVSVGEWEKVRGKVLITASQVEAFSEEMKDELDRLELERERKAAQLERARAQGEAAATLVERNNRLIREKANLVSPEERAGVEAKKRVADADIRIAEVDTREVDLRIRQVRRRLERVMAVARLAAQLKDEAQGPVAPGQPGVIGRPAPAQP